MSDDSNIENITENNISNSKSTIEDSKNVDLEMALEQLVSLETTAKSGEKPALGASTLKLMQGETNPVLGEKSPEIISEIADIKKASNRNVGSIRDIVKECQRIEALLGVKTKGLYTKSRMEVEIILDQRKAQLEEQSSSLTNGLNEKEKDPSTDDIFSNVKKPEEKPTTPVPGEKSLDQAPDVSCDPVTDKKPPVVHSRKKAKKSVTEDPLDKANADMLFRMNLLFLFSVETISEKYQDKLNTSFTGVTKKMASDYDRDEYLQGIYKRVYQENKQMIQTYASPLSELALYNASVLGTFAATNLDKTIKKSN